MYQTPHSVSFFNEELGQWGHLSPEHPASLQQVPDALEGRVTTLGWPPAEGSVCGILENASISQTQERGSSEAGGS